MSGQAAIIPPARLKFAAPLGQPPVFYRADSPFASCFAELPKAACRMSERSNIRDVAAHAGCGGQDRQPHLNGHPYVSADTRAKVTAAMRELNFHPSIAARILTGAKSNQIALIFDNHSPYYMFQMQAGCWDLLPGAWYPPARPTGGCERSGGGRAVTRTGVRDACRWHHLSSSPSPIARRIGRARWPDIPFVRISPGTNHALTSSVFMDDAQAADDMTTHLINVGHRRIGFIKGHPSHMASDDRLFGYRRALDRVAIAFEPQLIAAGEFDFESGVRRPVGYFLDLRNPPTRHLRRQRRHGRRACFPWRMTAASTCPAELSVAGFDDTTLARTVWPPLTTIRQPVAELARTATEILIAGGEISHHRLPHTLVERASVAPPDRTAS